MSLGTPLDQYWCGFCTCALFACVVLGVGVLYLCPGVGCYGCRGFIITDKVVEVVYAGSGEFCLNQRIERKD